MCNATSFCITFANITVRSHAGLHKSRSCLNLAALPFLTLLFENEQHRYRKFLILCESLRYTVVRYCNYQNNPFSLANIAGFLREKSSIFVVFSLSNRVSLLLFS